MPREEIKYHDQAALIAFHGFVYIVSRMQNQQVIQKIEKLKGRRAYEEKRAMKLGFATLYDYFEYKLQKSAFAADAREAKLERFKIEKELARTAKAEKKKSCGCC